MQAQFPDPLTVAEHNGPSTVLRTTTSVPGSPVPLKVGVLSAVVVPSRGLRIVGAIGTSVSTVNVIDEDGVLTFPARSSEVAVRVWIPSGSDAELQDQVPAASADEEQMNVLPS